MPLENLKPKLFFFCVTWIVGAVSYAGDPTSDGSLDAQSQEALSKTQQLLKDPKQRQNFIDKDSKASYVDKDVKALAGGSQENTNAIYGLSSDIMAEITQKSGGDPNKMMELLNKAKMDPKGFAESLSPENRAKLKTISDKISNENTGSAQPQLK